MEYGRPVWFEQTAFRPVMAPGVAGVESTVIDKHLGVLEPQALSAVTQTSPDVLPNVTMRDVVP